MRPGILTKTQTFVQGDQWDGFPQILILINKAPPTDNAADAKIEIRPQVSNPETSATLTVADGNIVINDATTWDFTVPPQTIDLRPGRYVASFRTEDVNGAKQTWFNFELEVLIPITKL
jgi:hypothetical protein